VTVSRRQMFALMAVAFAPPVRAYEFPPMLRGDVALFTERICTRHGLDEGKVRELLLEAQVLPGVLRAIATPGTAKPWHVFRANYLSKPRIDGGVAFWRENAPLLVQARETFGVPEELIVAIVGVETVYGRTTGSYRVLDALFTLGFEGQNRAAYFQSELEELMLLARDGVVDPRTVKGSYAGAMGWPQFMPSSLRRYGVDFDADGRVDLWSSPADIIGSVANYFRQFGWQTGADVVLRAMVREPSEAASLVSLGVKPAAGRQQFDAKGVTTERPLKDGELASLLLYEGENGAEYWAGLDNFYAITRYNRSQNYALAVWQLARALSEARSRASW